MSTNTNTVDKFVKYNINLLLAIAAIGQIAFLARGVFLEPEGSIFISFWALLLFISPFILAIDINLLTDTNWEPPLNGALWILGCVIPFVSSSILITYVGRRHEMVSKEGQWAGWPLLVGGSILGMAISLIAFIRYSESETFLFSLGGMALFSLTLLPGLCVFYDLRFLKQSGQYDFPSYNWLWILGIIVWFLQFGVFIGWAVWRKNISSKSNLRSIFEGIPTYLQNIDTLLDPDNTPSTENEIKNKKSGRSDSDGGKNNVSTAADYKKGAEEAIETAVTAEEKNNFEEAINAYRIGINEYQAAIDESSDDVADERGEFMQAVESIRDSLDNAKAKHKQKSELVGDLERAERSFQEAVIGFAQNDQTLARLRFRQARDNFDDAIESIEQNNIADFGLPCQVDVRRAENIPSTTISKLEAIPEESVKSLLNNQIKTLDDLTASEKHPWTPVAVEELAADGMIDNSVVTTLTLLSWWHEDDSYWFDSTDTIARRRQQAEYGFKHIE